MAKAKNEATEKAEVEKPAEDAAPAQAGNDELLKLVANLKEEVEQLKRQVDQPKPLVQARIDAERAAKVIERNSKMMIRVDKDGNPTGVEALTSYEPHVLMDPPKPNWAVWTKIQNKFDKKRIGEFRKRPVLFYSEHTDEHLAIADYERKLGTKFNKKTQVLKPHKE